MQNKIIFNCEICNQICQRIKKSFDKEEKHYCTSCKRKQTNLKKFGVDNPYKLQKTKDNCKKSIKEKYGVNSVFEIKEIQDKCHQTQIDKNGCLAFNTDKSKQTKIIKYNDENYNNREKAKQTCIKKYGVDNIWKDKQTINKLQKNINLGFRNNNTVLLSKQVKKKNFINYLFESRLINVIPVFSKDSYIDSNQYMKWKCNICGNEFEDNISSGKQPKCLMCFPINHIVSKGEKEIVKYLKLLNLNVIENSRSIIKPLELDIYIPDKNFAIEYNGSYWHSNLFHDKWYHQYKVEDCNRKNIRLLHIYDWQWNNEKQKCINRINYYLNNVDEKICARKPIARFIKNGKESNYYNFDILIWD